MKIQATPEIASKCETLFQNGGGRAQVYDPAKMYQCLYGCARPSEAIEYARPEQAVYYRAKGKDGRYTWFQVKGGNVTAPTRQLAQALRVEPNITPATLCAAAAAIDALLDAIEAGGMVEPRPAPVMDLGPLRTLREWHAGRRVGRFDQHCAFVDALNKYFPKDDQL